MNPSVALRVVAADSYTWRMSPERHDPEYPAVALGDVKAVLETVLRDERFRGGVAHWHELPAQPPVYADFPPETNPALIAALAARGIARPYTHQAEAMRAAQAGEHFVVVTPTASGKTLCYNLPVMDRILREPDARALYLFPTKALSRDQMLEVHELVTALGRDIKVYTFDGDTPNSARRAIRSSGHVVVTNPDMLHSGILPHHTNWIRLFEKLRYVVIDELHHYRGIFGSHLANVIRRLKRICAFYGSSPQFICASATIANPKEMAEQITGAPMRLIDNNGAPRGVKYVVMYNPPVVNAELGIRKSCVKEAARLALEFIYHDIQTIVFARSRTRVELLSEYLRRGMERLHRSPDVIRAYRGGYLPNERRAIEQGVKSGSILGVVSTNALELGIDIGQLKVSIIAGYPGAIASAWQQGGRAGRRDEASAMIMVASSAPLDQYLMNHPAYFYGASPESGIVNPNNLSVLLSHIKCAAFELPFELDEAFGLERLDGVFRYLEEEKIVRRSGDRVYYSSEVYPAEEVSLRSASASNFQILDATRKNQVIGEVDYASAPLLIHEEAIYLHQSRQFVIEKLDWENRFAYAREIDVDYYTDAVAKTDLKPLHVDAEAELEGSGLRGVKCFGAVSVRTLATKYKKIKFETHESVGYGDIHLPEQEMQTESYWVRLNDSLREELGEEDLGGGLRALATLLGNVIPLHVMCDPRDIRVLPMVRSPYDQSPTVYVYDSYPGGVGISKKAYELHERIVASTLELVRECGCEAGCPSCVGPALEVGDRGKEMARALLKRLAR